MEIERWSKTTTLPNGNKFTQYEDKAGRFRWRLQAKGNNEIIAASSQGFSTKQSAAMNYVMLRRHFLTLKILDN